MYIYQNIHNGDSQTNSKAGSTNSYATFKNINPNPNYQGSNSNPQSIVPMVTKQNGEIKKSSLSMKGESVKVA